MHLDPRVPRVVADWQLRLTAVGAVVEHDLDHGAMTLIDMRHTALYERANRSAADGHGSGPTVVSRNKFLLWLLFARAKNLALNSQGSSMRRRVDPLCCFEFGVNSERRSRFLGRWHIMYGTLSLRFSKARFGSSPDPALSLRRKLKSPHGSRRAGREC